MTMSMIEAIRLTLTDYRKKVGLTQNHLARRTYINEKTISAIETGMRTERLDFADLLAWLQVCGVTLAQFATDLEAARLSFVEFEHEAPRFEDDRRSA